MTPHDPDHIKVAFLHCWFSDLLEEEMRKAEEIYIRYLNIHLRIFEQRKGKEDERLTEPQGKQVLEEKSSTDEDEPPLPLAS